MIRAIVVVVAALAACDHSSSDEDTVKQAAAALDQIASGEAADRANLVKLRASAADLARQVHQVAQAWWTIAAEFDAATEACLRSAVNNQWKCPRDCSARSHNVGQYSFSHGPLC